MLIDTHAHLNFVIFEKNNNKIIQQALNNNIWIINIGTQYKTSKKAVEITKNYNQGVYAAIGLHPIYSNIESNIEFKKIKTDRTETNFVAEQKFNYQKYKQLALFPKVVAIGEIGLDYYWKPKTKTKLKLFKQKQKEIFLKQLNLAQELNLPVILHCRMAHDDLIEILNSKFLSNSKLQGVIHCFTGTLEQLKKYLNMGFCIGFNGIIFKNIKNINFKEIIRKTPLKKILLETDCPYLTPPQERNQKNKPLFIKYIAQEIAKIKNVNIEKVAKITFENAQTLFNI